MTVVVPPAANVDDSTVCARISLVQKNKPTKQIICICFMVNNFKTKLGKIMNVIEGRYNKFLRRSFTDIKYGVITSIKLIKNKFLK